MDTSPGRAAVSSAVPQLLVLSLCVALAPCFAGCKTDLTNPFLARQDSATRAGSVHGGNAPVATMPLNPRLLADGDWFEKPPRSYARRADTEHRWHHRRLDPYLHRSAPRTDLSESLSSTSPLVATNAAILAAHWGTSDPTEHLAAAVRTNKLPLPVRCAAAEALGRIEQPSPAPTVRELLAELAPLEPPQSPPKDEQQEEPLRNIPDLHSDLIRALARHAEPGDEPWFNAALSNSAWQVRLEGVAAWSTLADLTLPAQAIELRADRDPRVRAVALRTISAHRDPRAVTYLQESLDDADFDVRVAAIAGLSEIGTADAKALLGRLKDRGAEMQQAAALVAQATSTLGDDLQAAAADAQSQVQQAVAHSLDQAERRGRQLAAEKVDDAQQYVQQASAQAEQAVDDAKSVADSAARRIAEVQQTIDALREANLPEAARREAALALERLATDADAAMRERAAQAMGEVADPMFLPALMALLSDRAAVQTAAMVSLAEIAGGDVTAREGGRPLSDEERVRLWQLWYRERQDARP